MAEALGAVASALAVIELAAKTALLCTQYCKDISSAKDDIERIQTEVTSLSTVAKNVRELLESPKGAKLRTAQALVTALRRGQSQLEVLYDTLKPSKSRSAANRLGFRSLKWPFESKDVEKTVLALARCGQIIQAALQVDQMNIILDLDQKATLGRLPVADGAAFDSHADEHSPTCLPNTRVELLHEINTWIRNPTAGAIFWLNGIAGTGKSTISRTLARSASEKGCLGASFFFKRGEGGRSDASRFFTTIVAQFASREPELIPHIQAAIDSDPTIIGKAIREQFQKLIMGPLSKVSVNDSTSRTVLVVIDALDECDHDEDVKLLIQLLSRSKEIKHRRLKVFLTSRPELPIRLGFKAVQGTYQGVTLHEIAGKIIERDIEAFLRHEFARIRTEYNEEAPDGLHLPPSWPCQTDIQTLARMAVPLFIFAATVCRFICDECIGNPRKQLQAVLNYQTRTQISQLDATYLPVLDRLALNSKGKQRAEVWERFRDVVGSIITLADPLSMTALAQLLGKSHNDIHATLRLLHSVFSVSSDGPIRMFHLSFRDFLLDPEKCDRPFWVDETGAHKKLADQSLRLLAKFLRADICNVTDPGTLFSDIDPRQINDRIRPEIQYACRFWVYHLVQSQTKLSDDSEVHSFVATHFLHWLEALSWTRRGSDILQMLDALRDLVDTDAGSHLLAFLHDARRFASATILRVELAPLQVYSSGLLFAPKRSIVRSTFTSEIPSWITLQPRVEDTWDACERTLEGHSSGVSSVAFSPDGTIVASASDDRTVRLWSAETGAPLQTLEGHCGRVNSVAFSPDGVVVASASDDQVVRLWDAKTGAPLQTLEGHDNWVNLVVFSPDGVVVASASEDSTVRLWNAETGAPLQTFEGHSGSVNSVAFSPDGAVVASASYDQTVRLWNAETGTPLQTLEDHSGRVNSVAFSPDGAVVASASWDQIIRLWNAETGAPLQTLEGHSGRVNSVAFSPDGAVVASASWDQIIRLWNAETGAPLQTLEGHSGSINSVAFSPDGAVVASASEDQTVRLWNYKTGAPLQTLEGHNSDVNSVVFSPDGAVVASASWDQTVRLWDAETGEPLQTLKGHSNWVNSVAFSPDGAVVASASDDQTVRLWNAETGAPLQTLGGHSGRVSSVAFSPDGVVIASASYDQTVRLWSTATCTCFQTTDVGTILRDLSFNEDGSLLTTDVGTIAIARGTQPANTSIVIKGTVSPCLANPTQLEGSRLGLGISEDRCWVTQGGRNLLWLAADVRPGHSAVHDYVVALGNGSGKVTIMQFAQATAT